MTTELLYRFCVREKSTETSGTISKAAFITQQYLTETLARERFEIIERLDHTAIQPDALLRHIATPRR